MPQVTEILSDDALENLRRGWQQAGGDEAILAPADKNLVGAYAPSGPFVSWVSDHFYREGAMSGSERERVLISVLASAPPRFLAIHIYWGLMEGLSVVDVAETLLLTSAYQGIPIYSATIGVLANVLLILRDLELQGGTSPGPILGSIFQKYP